MPQHATQDPDLPVRAGELLAGKYRVERVLGQGAMGVVVAAMHEQLEERVAIKLLLPSGQARPDFIGRFIREARAAVKIKSAHVARAIDVGKLEDGRLYMVMEYLEGKDLARVLVERGSIPEGEAVDYVLQACEALVEAHALGIVHRDLKPSNLFLTEAPGGAPLVKVLDFGISKFTLKNGAAEDARLTASTAIIGSPLYMSPEQIRSARDVDGRADVWALGVILHELLTNNVPFIGDTHMSILASIAADEPAKLREHRPGASPELEAIIARCLQKDVNKRYQSVVDLARALGPFGPKDAVPAIERALRATTSSADRSSGSISGVRVSLPVDAMAETVHTLSETAPAKRRQRLVALATVLGGLIAVATAAFLTTRPSAPLASSTEAPPSAAPSASAAPTAPSTSEPTASVAPPEPPPAASSASPSSSPTAAAAPSDAPTGSAAGAPTGWPPSLPAQPGPLPSWDKGSADANTKPAGTPSSTANPSLPAPSGGIRLGKEVDTRR